MKRRALVLPGVLTSLLGSGCGGGEAREQWAVSVTTDAAIPQFGDRLVLEVLAETGELACEACRFTLGAPEKWPTSFGVVPGKGPRPLIRARLFRAPYAGADGLPNGPSVIDALGRLPAPSGITEVALHLSLGCFGVASDVGRLESCDPASGALGPVPVLAPQRGPVALPGSSELGRATPCIGTVPESMRCVGGGAFLRGAPQGFGPGVLLPGPEALVTLSPFALDAEETTVGQVRMLVREGKVDEEPALRSEENPLAAACTYLGPDDPSNDALPATCVTATLAASACSAVGKRLPTEAEWEFTAGNGARETTFPWGEGDDVCAYAVAARGRAMLPGIQEEATCLDGSAQAFGPVALGSDGDVTDLGVYNLGANVSEWVEDSLAPYGSPCTGEGRVLRDPLCRDTSTDMRVVRGGSWASRVGAARGAARSGAPESPGDPYTGFRCALTLAE